CVRAGKEFRRWRDRLRRLNSCPLPRRFGECKDGRLAAQAGACAPRNPLEPGSPADHLPLFSPRGPEARTSQWQCQNVPTVAVLCSMNKVSGAQNPDDLTSCLSFVSTVARSWAATIWSSSDFCFGHRTRWTGCSTELRILQRSWDYHRLNPR